MKLIFSLLLFSSFGVAQTADWTKIDEALGQKGKEQNGVYKESFPRTDLHVKVGNTVVEPAAGLGSWMAFRQDGNEVTADGDLVLTPDEIAPAVRELRSAGITVSGIHNHLAGEQPPVMYAHFFAHGPAATIATALHKALATTKTPQGEGTVAKPIPFPDEERIEGILGKKGNVNGKVLAFSFPRAHKISMSGHELEPAMGMATAINLQPSPLGVAATGDFVLQEEETQKVLSALSDAKIAITAMHNHLLNDEPRMVFVHFWAEGKADAVARGLKSALDAAAAR